MEIQRDELQQLVVSHLGQQHLTTALKQILRELALGVNESIDLFFHRPTADELVYEHVLRLADAKRTVGGLILDGWDSTSDSKCTTCEAAVRLSPAPPAFSERTKNGTRSSSWNCRTSGCRLPTVVSPCRTRPGRPKTAPRKRSQRCGHFAELREDEHFVLSRRNDLRDLSQSGELAAVGLAPRSIAQPVRGVIADLLEAHQRREHDAATFHPLGSLELGRQLGHRLLVERRLFARQVAGRPAPRSCPVGRR